MNKNLIIITSFVFSTLPLLTSCGAKCEVTIINNNPDMGEVSGEGFYRKGSQVELTATPYDTFAFAKWTGDCGNSARKKWHFIIEESCTIYANFENAGYDVNIQNDQDSLLGIVKGSKTTKWGDKTEIEIKPYSGYKVESWTEVGGETLSNKNALDIEMPKHDIDVELTFTDNYLYFGKYPQHKVKDNDLNNTLSLLCNTNETYIEYEDETYYRYLDKFYLVEPLKWDVTYEEEDKVCLMTSDIIFACDDTGSMGNKYRSSNLRTYLKDTFYNEAFTAEEKTKFAVTYLSVESGITISDPVFIMFENLFNDYFSLESFKHKPSIPTDLAMDKGVRLSESYRGNLFVQCGDFVMGNVYGDNVYYYAASTFGTRSGGIDPYGIRPMILLDKEAINY